MRVRHPKLSCKILVYAYSRTFPKTTASYAQLFLSSISGSHVYRRISTLTMYSKVKLRAIERTDCSLKAWGKHPNQARPVFMVSRSMQCVSMAYVPKHFLTFRVKDAGGYPRLLSSWVCSRGERKRRVPGR